MSLCVWASLFGENMRYEFDVPTVAHRVVAALIVAHGSTDLQSFDCLLIYILSYFLPVSSKNVTGLFCFFSVLHFTQDLEIRCSLLLHLLILLTALKFGKQRAIEFVGLYMSIVHLPAHYARCFVSGRHTGLTIAALASVAAVLVSLRSGRKTVSLTDTAQRVAIGHIVYELALHSPSL